MRTVACFSLLVGLVGWFLGVGAAGQDLFGVKCIVKGDQQALADVSSPYRDGTVYFCCKKCQAAFEAEMKKEKNAFATMANHQLVLTGQYVQKGCPFSGEAVKEEEVLQVGGIEIGFCCAVCRKKVEAAEGLAAKAELVFGNGPFEKGFERKPDPIQLDQVKCVVMPEKEVKEKYTVPYEGHQVFFCCKGCLRKFSKSPETYLVRANHQLVATGQVKQTACPISGKPVVDDIVSEVAGVKVKFCCEKCKAKVDAAEGDAQLELVFGKEPFAKGFAEAEKPEEN